MSKSSTKVIQKLPASWQSHAYSVIQCDNQVITLNKPSVQNLQKLHLCGASGGPSEPGGLEEGVFVELKLQVNMVITFVFFESKMLAWPILCSAPDRLTQ